MRSALLTLLLVACASSTEDTSVAAGELVGADWMLDQDPTTGTLDLVVPPPSVAPARRAGETASQAAVRFFRENPRFAGPAIVPIEEVDDGLVHVRFADRILHFTKSGTIAFLNIDHALPHPAPSAPADFDVTAKGMRTLPPISDPNDTKTIAVTKVGSSIELVRAPLDGSPSITVRNMNRSVVSSPSADDLDPVAVDAFASVTGIVDWYRTKHGWTEFNQPDGLGLDVIVHANGSLALASYSAGLVVTKDGDAAHGGDQLPSVTLSILGHELTHGVTAMTSRLDDVGEAGTVNEAVSDIFASLMAHDRGVANALQTGADATVSGKPLRDFVAPASTTTKDQADVAGCKLPSAPPDHESKKYTGTCDMQGVHVNIGIVTNAFALMTAGGKNPTSGIAVKAPLGWDVSSQLWWTTERAVLLPSTTISSLARWQIALAQKASLPVEPVACAWVATGVVSESYAMKYGVTCNSPL